MGTGMKADGNIVIGTSVDVGGIDTGLSKIQKSVKRLGKLATLAIGAKAFISFGQAALEAASDLTEVQNVVDVAFGDMEYKVENFCDTCIDKFGMSELAAKETAGSFMAMGNAIGFASEDASDMAIWLTAATGDMASFYNISQDYAKVALSAVYTGETETLKRYGIILTEANLQQYALSRGITTSVKSMDAQSKTALRFNYIMSIFNQENSNGARIMGDFVRTTGDLDSGELISFANGVRLLKNTWTEFLIVVGGGLKTVLSPVILALRNMIKYVTQLTAALWRLLGINIDTSSTNTGISSSAGAATDALEDETDAMNNASKAAKNLLSPLDELNVLNESSSSSSSSGGSGSVGLDDIDMSDIYGEAKDQQSLIIDSFYEWGNNLGTAIVNALDSIPWDEIKAKAALAGQHLAEALNGFADAGVFESLGRTIAEGLNAAVQFGLNFAINFDFSGFGAHLAGGVNEFFNTFDFKAFGTSVKLWCLGIWSMIKSFLTNLDWSAIFNGIYQFFSGLGVDGLMALMGLLILKRLIKAGIARAFIGGITEGLGLVSFTDLFAGLGLKIGTAISTALGNLGAGISLAFGQAFTDAAITADTLMGSGGAGIGATISAWGTSLRESFVLLFGEVGAGLLGLGTTLGGVILSVTSFFDQWKNGFSWLKEALMIIGDALAVVGAIIAGVAAWPAVIVGAVVAAISTIVILLHDNWDAVKEWFHGWWDPFVEKLLEIWTWIDTNIITPVKEGIQFFIDWISAIFEGLRIIIEAIWILASTWVNEHIITPIKNLITPFIDGVKKKVTKLWDDIKAVYEKVTTWLDEHIFTPVKDTVESVKNTIADTFSNLWTTITDGLKGAVNTCFGVIENLVNGIINAINTFFSGFNKIVSAAASITGASWGGVPMIPNVALPRLATGAVIPPNNEFLAVLGDQKSGTNIEAPLTTIQEAVALVLEPYLRELVENTSELASKDYSVKIGDKEIARANTRGQRQLGYKLRTT